MHLLRATLSASAAARSAYRFSIWQHTKRFLLAFAQWLYFWHRNTFQCHRFFEHSLDSQNLWRVFMFHVLVAWRFVRNWIHEIPRRKFKFIGVIRWFVCLLSSIINYHTMHKSFADIKLMPAQKINFCEHVKATDVTHTLDVTPWWHPARIRI